MKEEHIIKQLSMLKNIEPDADFARSARMAILYRTEPVHARFFGLTQSLSGTLAIGLVVMFIVFIAIGGVATVLRTPLSPTLQGVSEQNLASEAGSINETIDVHLSEVDYLARVESKKLAQAAPTGANTDEEIDMLLDEAKNY